MTLLPRRFAISWTPSFVAIQVEQDLLFSDVNNTSLNKLVKDKDQDALVQFGGIDSLVTLLQSDKSKGIKGNREDICCRQRAFGCKRYHKLTTKSFFHFVLIAMKDPIIISFLVCAILILGFRIHYIGLKYGWTGGGTIAIAVLVVVTVCSISHFWPYREFNKLSQMSKLNHIKDVRNGQQQQLSVTNIVVGDVICLTSGDQVPADGLLLSSNSSLKMDESSLVADNHHVQVDQVLNPFLFSGTTVESGHGEMLVTSVGENTRWSEIMSFHGHEYHTWRSLESQLKALTTVMGIVGSIVAMSTLIVLLTRYFSGNMKYKDGVPRLRYIPGETSSHDAWKVVVGIILTTVVVASSAIPEACLWLWQ